MANEQEKKPQTLVISNFTGSLTRVLNGDLNSGLAKFRTSWGYNPFTKPQNLTWNVEPFQITDAALTGLVLAGKVKPVIDGQQMYIITDTAKLILIDFSGTTFTVTLVATLTAGTPTFEFGADLEFYNGKIYISNDKGVTSIDFDGMNEAQVGTWDAQHYLQDTYHALESFIGKLFVGNTTNSSGTTTNIGTIDTTNTITNYNTLSPALPTDSFVKDMDITSDFIYLVISASYIAPEPIAPGNDILNASAGDSFRFQWNGTDAGVTSGITLPNFGITSLINFGDTDYSFMYDSIGVALYSGGRKILSLPDAKSPAPGATQSSGNQIVWSAPEVDRQIDPPGQTSLNSMYFFGQLDAETPVAFWRMLRQLSNLTNGSVNQVPFMQYFTNQYVVVNPDGTLTQFFPYIFYSRQTFNGGSPENQLWVFTYATGGETALAPVKGIYETQTQLFSKRISISQVRVYTEPTIAGNGFQLDLIGTDGHVLDSGTFNYIYGDVLDPQTNVKEVDRINFNPTSPAGYGIGIRITNTGSTNMTIKKIEVDVSEQGK